MFIIVLAIKKLTIFMGQREKRGRGDEEDSIENLERPVELGLEM